ncbi:MAG: glycosyltransferase family 4 protein [Myxococcota bacterium]
MAVRPVALLGSTGPRRPRVLAVSPPVTPPWLNGTAVLVHHLAGAGEGFRYHLLGVRGQRSPGAHSVIEPLYGAGGGSPLLARARLLARLVRPDRCALHHFFFAPHPRAVGLAKLALRVSRKRSVHTMPSLPDPALDPRRLVFADRTVVLTEASAVHLRSHGVEGVRVVRPAVPVPPVAPDRDAARRRLALSSPGPAWADAPVFLYPGDLEFSDGARVFVEAAARAAEAVPEARFVLACRPKTAASAAVLEGLRRRVRDLGLESRVTFLGVVSDMQALLAAVDAVVLPVDTLYAKVDTPFAVLEAMAMGTPAVVSDLPQLSELAGLGEGTLVVRRSDPDDLARRLVALGENPSLRRSLGEGARRTVRSHFRPRAMAVAYEALYRELIG